MIGNLLKTFGYNYMSIYYIVFQEIITPLAKIKALQIISTC